MLFCSYFDVLWLEIFYLIYFHKEFSLKFCKKKKGAFSYCIELQPKQSQLIIDGIFILQFAFSAIFQFLGQGVGELSSRYDYAFAFVSLTMIIAGIPVIFVLIRRLVMQKFSSRTPEFEIQDSD